MEELRIENLAFSYDRSGKKEKRYVIDRISFSVRDGESVGIIGNNGAGKSTLLKLLCGIETRYEGILKACDLDVRKENLEQVREKIGYVFQDSDSQLFMPTVYDDVAFAPENYGLEPEEVRARTEDALRKVHMETLAGERIYRLSGGQKKLAAIATVLSMRPELLLLDEPSAALDPGNRRNLIHVLNEIPTAKVIASHDLDFIYDTCSRAILLNHGKIVADGSAEEILRDQGLLEQNNLELPLSFSRREQ